MRSKTKKLAVPLMALILLAAGISGYARPDIRPEEPVRILLANNGGNVIFNHTGHCRALNGACDQCHHEGAVVSATEDGQPSCGACHPKDFAGDFSVNHVLAFMDDAACACCHHARIKESLFDHGAHSGHTDDCADCHHQGKEPERCRDCHGEMKKGATPGLGQAVHERCAACHEEVSDVSYANCRTCHVVQAEAFPSPNPQPCSDCHVSPVEELVPLRTEAFHGQCQSCHVRMNVGPHGPDSCKRCHITR